MLENVATWHLELLDSHAIWPPVFKSVSRAAWVVLMSDERGNSISALSLGSPTSGQWLLDVYIMCAQVTSIQNISGDLSWAGETEGDTVPSKYSPTHL